MQKFFCLFLIIILLGLPRPLWMAVNEDGNLIGRILLQVEENGEAWYVSPQDSRRYYLGRPRDAFQIMREQGVGITNVNLEKFPVGVLAGSGEDTDGDSVPDSLELTLGLDPANADTDGDSHSDGVELKGNYNARGSGQAPVDTSFSFANRGKIFLQVESNGEAWYINPADSRRYYLGRPADAFAAMRSFGLGITNDNLNKIVTTTPVFNINEFEEKLYELVNQERSQRGLRPLAWNDAVAAVAREHSDNMAKENKAFTGFAMSCDYPFIHHEGLDFGLHNSERLNTRKVFNFSKTGENIALMSAAELTIRTTSAKNFNANSEACQNRRAEYDQDYNLKIKQAESEDAKIAVLKDEITRRTTAYQGEELMPVSWADWFTANDLARDIVTGWMESSGHRDNILIEEYDETGMGIVESNGYVFATQIFITRAECGYEAGQCCEKAGFYPYCFLPLECGDEGRCGG